MRRGGLGRQEILGRRHLGALSTRVRSGGCEWRHHLSREGRPDLPPRARQCPREQLPPLHDREWKAEHDRIRESHRAEARRLAYDSCRRRRPQDPGLPRRHDAAQSPDKTFTDGWVGLWTKADSVTEFSDLEVTGTVAN